MAVKLFMGLEDDGGLAEVGAEVDAELSILAGLDHPHVLKASAGAALAGWHRDLYSSQCHQLCEMRVHLEARDG